MSYAQVGIQFHVISLYSQTEMKIQRLNVCTMIVIWQTVWVVADSDIAALLNSVLTTCF